ncbi:lambda-exonuclease family protein [uncultured Sneathia sp.]|uniref:YqaJ viral recombinase family nuclease n=1 Tax=uncultured Sneathia sp. TaxID=278067 RepID=UPI0025960A47|nr:YqaJ viral recombinase family protein [uncultured Sneathia sp.]
MIIALQKEELKEVLPNKEVEILDFNSQEDWHKLRSKGIGGSDIGAILGVNKYRSLVDVYLDKTEGKKVEDNNAMFWGRVLEPIIRAEFQKKHSEEYQTYLVPYSLKYGVLRANVDGLIYNNNTQKWGVLEIKTANQFTTKEWSDGVVPQSYYAQVMHYLTVTGLDYAIIVVLIGGNDYREFYIERNEDEVKAIKEVAEDFWNTYIIPQKIPAPDGSDSYSEYQKELLAKYETFSNRVELDDDMNKLLDESEEKKQQIKELEKEVKETEQKIMNIIIDNEADLAESDKYKVKLVTQNRTKVDPKFKTEQKELINKYKEMEEKYRIKYKTNFLKISMIGE